MKKKKQSIKIDDSRVTEMWSVPHLFGDERDRYLARLGFGNLRDLLAYAPLQAARTLAAVGRGQIPKPQLTGMVNKKYHRRDAAEALSWPVKALQSVEEGEESRIFEAIGIRTIGDLAQFAREVDKAVLNALEDNGFSEPPSAPAQLLPGMIGSVSSSVRFSSFIRDTELRKLTFSVDKNCTVPLPISSLVKYDNTLGDMFEKQKCPVVHLGYMCGHRQKWINLGTHLGEVVHSISLAPGESRNIALVNWRRRQLTALEEHTTTNEKLTATFIQNRALKEITTAVAREHQSGRTKTEANTDVTAASFVAAGGVVGGIAGGVGGAVVGGLSGLAVDVMVLGTDLGTGTILGTVGGGIAGAAVGGAAGMAAGGLVYSGAQALGMIEADTEGDREIIADVHQRISLSTSQTASAVRSLWSTVVVEDAQAEDIEVQTSNITNYNHMHALNMEYYEVLQHYLARIEVENIQPIIFLPFTFFDFTNFRFVRDYWEAVRLHITDEALQSQGDAYFVTEGPPEAPDLLPVPPMPVPPTAQEAPTLENLKIDVLFKSLPFNTNIGLDVMRGTQGISGEENENSVPPDDLDGYDWGNRYTFDDIEDAHEISGVSLSRNQFFSMDVKYRIRVYKGKLHSGDEVLENIAGQVIASNRTIAAGNENQTFEVFWEPAEGFETENTQALDDYNTKKAERDGIIAENQSRNAAYEVLVENIDRFKQRLQRLILRRRHFFTRVILNAIEPEEIAQLLESLRIGHENAGNSNFGIPVSEFAHTIPLGMTAGGFILKLKRLDKDKIRTVAQRWGMDKEVEELETLLTYADQTLSFFDDTDHRESMAQTDHVYVPTGGLFAESILGRANGAEYLDMERYFNWQDAPIPHQAPAIQPVETDSRFQQSDVSVNVPEGNLQVIAPAAMPEPTGLQNVLQAIQNPNIFRDMSKANELAGIIGSLSTLAGKMGESASTMTGKAAEQTLKSATEVSKAAATMAQSFMDQAFKQAGAGFSTMSSKGAALNQAAKIDKDSAGQTTPAPNTNGAPASVNGNGTPSLEEETFRELLGLDDDTVFASGNGESFEAPDLTVPGDQVSPFLWRDLIEFEVPQDVLDMLESRDMSSLSLAGASGPRINLDYFPIHVTKLPVVDGQQLTAEQFLEHIRKNLHTNLMIATALGEFAPYADEDEQLWFGNNPYKAVLGIDLMGPDNAAVVCAESGDDHWIFNTVATPDTGSHPVSGQRMFGYWSPAPGEFVFYTRGADRTTSMFDSLAGEQVFGGGAAIWATFQAGVAGFVNTNGGEATVPRAFSGRYSWYELIGALNALEAQSEAVTPI